MKENDFNMENLGFGAIFIDRVMHILHICAMSTMPPHSDSQPFFFCCSSCLFFFVSFSVFYTVSISVAPFFSFSLPISLCLSFGRERELYFESIISMRYRAKSRSSMALQRSYSVSVGFKKKATFPIHIRRRIGQITSTPTQYLLEIEFTLAVIYFPLINYYTFAIQCGTLFAQTSNFRAVTLQFMHISLVFYDCVLCVNVNHSFRFVSFIAYRFAAIRHKVKKMHIEYAQIFASLISIAYDSSVIEHMQHTFCRLL